MIIWSIAAKDLKLLFRDRSGCFFVFAFPVLFSVFFGIVFSGGSKQDREIPVAVVDLDQSVLSKAFVQDLLTAEEFKAELVDTKEIGDRRVLSRKAAAVVVIPKDFGERQKAMFSGKPPELDVGIDPSRQAETGMLTGVLQKYAFMGMSRSFQDPARARVQLTNARTLAKLGGGLNPNFEKLLVGLDGVLADAEKAGQDTLPAADLPAAAGAGDGTEPVKKNRVGGMGGFSPMTIISREVRAKSVLSPNAFAVSFSQGVVWGVMGAALGFGTSLVGERQRGTLARLRCAPLGVMQILLGKALACGITVLMVIGLLLGLAKFGFGVTFAEPVSLVLATVCGVVCFVGLMMLVAAASPTERSGGGMAWGVMMMFAFLGGAAVPLFVMPGWMQQLSNISPMKWLILSFEGGIWRGTTPLEMLLPCTILVGIGVVSFLSGTVVFLRKRDG